MRCWYKQKYHYISHTHNICCFPYINICKYCGITLARKWISLKDMETFSKVRRKWKWPCFLQLGIKISTIRTSSSAVSYHRKTELQGGPVLAKSGRHYRSIFTHFKIIGLQSYRVWWNNAKRAITLFKVIISVNWIFFARCHGWGATSEYLFKIGDFAPMGARWPKISGIEGSPPPTIFLFRELG